MKWAKNGGCKKAVTTSDSCWLIRGHHSQCCTFVVVNFFNRVYALSWQRSCMRGSNNISGAELWEGVQKLLRDTWQRFVSTKLKRRKWLLQLIAQLDHVS